MRAQVWGHIKAKRVSGSQLKVSQLQSLIERDVSEKLESKYDFNHRGQDE
jgi:hypothetical protein